MSIKLMSRIWDDAPFEKTTLLVLLCLADMANDAGVCWPSVDTIARKARCSPRWVRDVLMDLESQGYVGKEMRAGQTTKYHVYFPPAGTPTPEVGFTPEETSPLNSGSGEGGSGVQGGAEVGFRKGGSGVQPNHKEPSIEPPMEPSTTSASPTETADFLKTLGLPMDTAMPGWLTNTVATSTDRELRAVGLDIHHAIDSYLNCGHYTTEQPNESRFQSWAAYLVHCKLTGEEPKINREAVEAPADLETAFAMFWEAYPKKERKPVALAAFKAAVRKVDNPVTIINGAKGYARKVRRDGTEEQYMKSPTNWLNDEQWLDKYPTALASRSRTAADY